LGDNVEFNVRTYETVLSLHPAWDDSAGINTQALDDYTGFNAQASFK